MSRNALHIIANILAMNSQYASNNGLFKGKMGISLFFFLYDNQTNNSLYLSLAKFLLEEVIDNLQIPASINSIQDLAETCCGILYLLNEGIIEGNPDEIMEEIDSFFESNSYAPLCYCKHRDIKANTIGVNKEDNIWALDQNTEEVEVLAHKIQQNFLFKKQEEIIIDLKIVERYLAELLSDFECNESVVSVLTGIGIGLLSQHYA